MVSNTPKLLEHAAPLFPSSSACGCSASTLCPASWPELSSADFLQHTGSSTPSASSHTGLPAPRATTEYNWAEMNTDIR